MTPPDEGDLQRFPSWKLRKPVPTLQEASSPQEAAQNPDHSQSEGDCHIQLGATFPPPKSWQRDLEATPRKNRSGTTAEILSPSPTRRRDERDTINNIVDIYNRDSALSSSTADFEPHDEASYDEMSPRKEREYDYEHDGDSSYRGSGASAVPKHGEEGKSGMEEGEMMQPPGMVFDLTPGREPSPARYKHGEPLAFGEPLILSLALTSCHR